MSEWQLFETAPETGDPILVYRKDANVFTAHYVSPAEMIDSDDEDRLWFTTDGEDLTGDLPTHWMPLPDPPSPEAAGG